MAYLELKNIRKSYQLSNSKKFPVLKGISLDFQKGEFVSILGESGGGKTTLMNVIGGLDHDYKGDVIIDGQSTKNFNQTQMDEYRRQTIGFIFQSFNLINYQTNLENVMTSLEMTDLSKADRKKRAAGLLKQVGLEKHMNKYPSQLSGGQKQRVAIARALASDPDVIIADEPTGALDSQTTKEILELLDEIAKTGKLVIAVTHSQEVADYGTRIVHIADGKIGKQKRLKKAYKPGSEEAKGTNRQLQELANPKPAVHSRVLRMRSIWNMAWDHLRFNKLRNFLIMFGGAIGIFSVILFLGMGNGVRGYINEQVTAMVNPKTVWTIQADKSDQARNKSQHRKVGSGSMNFSTIAQKPDLWMTQTNVDQLRKIKHVKNAHLAIDTSSFNVKIDGKSITGGEISSYLKSAYNHSKIRDTLASGKMPTNGNEIVVSENVAKQWNAKQYKQLVGKTIEVSLPNGKEDKTLTFNAKVAGISKNAMQQEVNLVNNQVIFDAMKANKQPIKTAFVAVDVDQTANVKSVAKKIEKQKIKGSSSQYNTATIGSTLDQVNTFTNVAATILAMIAGISLFVSAIMIIVTTYMSVSERTKEIGVLRALGARSKDISRLFLYEALCQGLFGALLGLLIAYGIAALMNKALYSMTKYNMVQISTGNIIFAIVISLIIAFLAAFVPSRKAAKLDPIECLSAE